MTFRCMFALQLQYNQFITVVNSTSGPFVFGASRADFLADEIFLKFFLAKMLQCLINFFTFRPANIY